MLSAKIIILENIYFIAIWNERQKGTVPLFPPKNTYLYGKMSAPFK